MSDRNIIEEFIAHRDLFGEDEQIVIAFVRLYQTQPELFSDFQNSLAELCDNLPDDLEEISEKILAWCQDEAPQVNSELLQLLPASTKAVGGSKNQNVEQAKELIDNVIRTSIRPQQKNDRNQPSSKTSQS